MTEKERLETLLTALEAALGLLDETMHYTAPMSFDDINNLNQINDSYAALEAYAKHEREKQAIIGENDKE